MDGFPRSRPLLAAVRAAGSGEPAGCRPGAPVRSGRTRCPASA
ncbi:hypothetical protein SLNWT_5253 [Streptomyces albus]|uniref:Uncharacterized protein n=1 Tax=Streptomyces albus (strain ATCC 21838 / DSM 41398 / FERM P-419 / JCM 4703 / NBRC 107858) TaxID=1081613 RepID=A0A0B5EV24_STRA4|nr:hypothetical protein SLNWT_5253 [Streptomyces albus]AOU79931.1 hypothetical protein SLNHY_5240 [Streptomyces albus]AYN35648.1 hypothetical protein DUI70_5151 [Streptomyces albus]